MTALIFQLLGGIGLFLLGMVLLTDGLKAFAGDALQRALVRFTGTPLKAFASGALATALVQSSSATTVTVIGFVSAGLLTFPQAVGVVMGASLGTTGTGWIVAVLGLKVSLGFYAMPLIGIGAFMKLLGRGKLRSLGLAIAGFGLIFIGLDAMQTGMSALSGVFNLSQLPAGGLWGHLLAMAIGTALTVLMQSSSAAVATTLTALHSGAINFEQAASLVIGAAIGTTVTGALAAIGGSPAAKRTALAHILFNLATGLIAIVLLPLFLGGLRLAQTHLGLDPGATSLAAFHTLFILVGVAIFLPIAGPCARRIERLLPDRGPMLTRHLDNTLLHAPPVALEATRRALVELTSDILAASRAAIQDPRTSDPGRLAGLHQGLDAIRTFFGRIPVVAEDVPISHRRVAQVHAIDHLQQWFDCLPPPADVRNSLGHDRLATARERVNRVLELTANGLSGAPEPGWREAMREASAGLADLRRHERLDVLQQAADGGWDPGQALEVLDGIRWLDRLGYHAWRVADHLGGPASG